MKYCPKCGNALPDDALFCNKCGEKQPGTVVEEEAHVETREARVTTDTHLSPRERYNKLLKEDESFRELVKVNLIQSLFSIIRFLAFIVWIIAMFTPVAVFEGGTASGNTPVQMSPYMTIAFSTVGELTPGDSLNGIMPIMFLIVGPIIGVLLVLVPILNAFTRRGYFLRQYEAGNMKGLIREQCRPNWAMALFGLFFLAPSLQVFLVASTVEYKKDPSSYILGKVSPLTSGFVTVCVIAVLVFAIVLAASIVTNRIFTKKLRNYL